MFSVKVILCDLLMDKTKSIFIDYFCKNDKKFQKEQSAYNCISTEDTR